MLYENSVWCGEKSGWEWHYWKSECGFDAALRVLWAGTQSRLIIKSHCVQPLVWSPVSELTVCPKVGLLSWVRRASFLAFTEVPDWPSRDFCHAGFGSKNALELYSVRCKILLAVDSLERGGKGGAV